MVDEVQLAKKPLRVVICDLDVDEAGLCCPTCGCTYLRPIEVAVEQGSTKTVIRRRTTRTEEVPGADRGVAIWLDFRCNSGHRVRYRLELHNGQTLCELQTGCDQAPANDELWRQ